MSTRRGFMASILAAGFAPAAVGSGVLMPVRKLFAAPQVLVLHAGRICYVDELSPQTVRIMPANFDWLALTDRLMPKGRM